MIASSKLCSAIHLQLRAKCNLKIDKELDLCHLAIMMTIEWGY